MTTLEAALPELASFDIFNGLSKSQIMVLCAHGQVIHSGHRNELFHVGDEAHFFGVVLSGAYKLSRPSPMGEDVIIHFSLPGEIIAAFVMAQNEPTYPVSAIAMGPSRFLKIKRKNYIEEWQKNPSLILKIQNLLSHRITLFQDQKVMIKAPLVQKVAALLITLIEKEKTSELAESVLPIPITRKEIADTLGATVESVIRIMSEWSKSGIIKTHDSHIHIIQIDKLMSCLKPE